MAKEALQSTRTKKQLILTLVSFAALTLTITLAFQNCGSFEAAQMSSHLASNLQSATGNNASSSLLSTVNDKPGYDIIIIAGQSNAVGYGCGSYTDVAKNDDGRIFQVSPTNDIIPATDPLFFNTDHVNKIGFGMTFARLYAAAMPAQRKVLLVPVAKGATSILQWDPTNEGVPFLDANGNPSDATTLWDGMISRTTAALNAPSGGANQIVALLWHQGENDYTTIKGTTAAFTGQRPWMANDSTYKTRMQTFIQTFRNSFASGTALPIVVGQLGDFWAAINGTDPGNAYFNQFNQGIASVVASSSNIALTSAAGLSVNTVACPGQSGPDFYHFSAQSQIDFGKRYYAAFKTLQPYVSSTVQAAPHPPTTMSLGMIPAGFVLTCDAFNPDAIKSLPADTITWLGSLQPSGLTLQENYLVARQQGYTGAFGNGEHNAWLAQDPERLAAFNSSVQLMATMPSPPWANWAAHNQDRRAHGYNGLFMCGGDTCFQQGMCDNLGRRFAQPVQVPDIAYGAIKAGVPISCDSLNPDAIKSLSTDTIQWLASLQPSGITLHENYMIARQLGYNGAFGNGEHNAWLAMDPNRLNAFNAAVQAMATGAAPPWANWAAHNQDRRAHGYNGVFLCGGDNCFQANQCDNLGRRK